MSVVWVDAQTFKNMVLEASKHDGEVVLEARGFDPVLIRFYDREHEKRVADEIEGSTVAQLIKKNLN